MGLFLSNNQSIDQERNSDGSLKRFVNIQEAKSCSRSLGAPPVGWKLTQCSVLNLPAAGEDQEEEEEEEGRLLNSPLL